MNRQVPREGTGILGAVAQSAPLPFVVVDKALQIVEANRAFRRLARRMPAELTGRPLAHMLPGLSGSALEAALRPVTEKREHVVGARVGTSGHPSQRAWSVSAFPVVGEETLAVLVEDVTERLLVERLASTAAARTSLLLEAGLAIGTTLDVDATLDEVTKVLVPAFADQAIIDFSPGEVVSSGQGGHHRDQATQGTHTPAPSVRRVLETGRSVLVDVTDDATLDQVARSADHRTTLMVDRVHSFCCVPLIRMDRTIGALSAYSFGGRAGFGEHDLALLREIAGRVSTALDHADSFDGARRTAIELQRRLLPSALPTSATVEVATRYVPAGPSSAVGGDWYDVIAGARGRTAFAIGDVMGRGVHAAAMMGQIRTAMRTLASSDPPPGELLDRLDEVVRDLQLAPFATCLYGVYDPISRRLTVASAGHLPPVLLEPGRDADMLSVPVGPPLGVGEASPAEERELEVADGSVLALYTNGLVERRDRPLEDRLRLLRRSLAGATGSLVDRCESVVGDLLLSSLAPHDDVALLLASLRGSPAGFVASEPVRVDPAYVRQARERVTELARPWRFTAELDDVRVMVSELVTNGVRYGRGARQLTLARLADRICVEVSDHHDSHPRVRRQSLTDERGRGLAVVDALADRWGSRPTRHGKTVWFETLTSEPAPRRVATPTDLEIT